MKQQIVLDLLNEALLENNTLFIVEVKFLDNNPEFILATLDKALKRKVKNRIMTIRNKKKLEIF